MRSENSEHQRQNTEARIKGLRKSEGKAEYVLGMYSLILVMVLALASIQIMQYKADSDIAEDALAASCLAALDADPYRYGLNHKLVINDPVSARGIFENALRKNMNLDDSYRPLSGGNGYVSGNVTIEDFRIYLIDGDEVTEYVVTDYAVTENKGTYGIMQTPSGSIVRSAGAYARVSFDTEGFLGVRVRACKEAYAEMLACPDGNGILRTD
ncbi:MAG: hypothetical protein K5871_08780 [Lachnospiraceae bacterium]|nr:hypothetical protein [Lachnospiraceae bacterium]